MEPPNDRGIKRSLSLSSLAIPIRSPKSLLRAMLRRDDMNQRYREPRISDRDSTAAYINRLQKSDPQYPVRQLYKPEWEKLPTEIYRSLADL
ncbi:hypothetical protein Tco_0807215 [Tanacetum coccineum]